MNRSYFCGALILPVLLGYSLTAGAQAQEPERRPEEPSTAEHKIEKSEQDEKKSAADITAVPNRPTFASTAEMVQLGVFEIEYGAEAAQGHQNNNGLLKWGAVKNLESWFLNNPIERDSGTSGVGDSGPDSNSNCFPKKRRGQHCPCSTWPQSLRQGPNSAPEPCGIWRNFWSARTMAAITST